MSGARTFASCLLILGATFVAPPMASGVSMTSDTTNASVAQYVRDSGPASAFAPRQEIPYTGYPVLPSVVLGFVLLASGLVLRGAHARAFAALTDPRARPPASSTG